MEKILCEHCGKHIANLVNGNFVEIENWGMSESEKELCAECCQKEDRRELELEAAQCIWEAVLEQIYTNNPDVLSILKTIGTVELRYQLRQEKILSACSLGWEMLGTNGKQEKMTPYDWEYVPWFVKNCLDWTTLKTNVDLKSDWKEIIESI